MKKMYTFLLFLSLLAVSQDLFSQKGYQVEVDKKVKPETDFYKYVNGPWLDATEIPASEVAWGSFNELFNENRQTIKAILEEAEAKNAIQGSTHQLVGDLYHSGMDETAINKLGIEPIEDKLASIKKIADVNGLMEMIADFQNKGISSPFYYYSTVDARNSSIYAAHIAQSGLSLPSRTYYLEDDPRSTDIRKEFLAHVKKMFTFTGVEEEKAAEFAQTILDLETRLAWAQRSPVQNRDPEKRYNRLTIDDLQQMTFNIDWPSFFKARESEQPEYLVVSQPEFIAMFDRMLGDESLEDWKTYLQWKLINSTASALSGEFVDENFHFYGTVLRGSKEQQERWKRIQSVINNNLGDPLGKLYVAKAFPPEAKERMIEMIENLKAAFADRIDKLDWMSDVTKAEAKEKLKAISYKIGYPDNWRDYSSIKVTKSDYLGNLWRINEYNSAYNINRIGEPVDPNDWGMSPPTVNAYYSPTRNEIVFPAGILQPPFFDRKADDAINYGAIGAAIGHEITHGFDDSGSRYDAEGNLRMWWTDEDRERFDKRAQMVVDQFDGYKVLDSLSVDGQLTLGENIADLGGLAMAYDALQKSFEKNGRPGKIGGFTPEQRFFIGFGRVWRVKFRDQYLLELIKTDPHSPGMFRTNGTLSNMPSFFDAFSVPEGAPMRRDELIKIW